MTRVLLDTSVALYADGVEHRYREPCRRILTLSGDGVLRAEASVQLLEEYAHVRIRRGLERDEVVRRAELIATLLRIHDFTAGDGARMLSLLDAVPSLGAADAAHAGTALNRGLEAIISPDRDFDAVPGLSRIDPADGAAIEGLVEVG